MTGATVTTASSAATQAIARRGVAGEEMTAGAGRRERHDEADAARPEILGLVEDDVAVRARAAGVPRWAIDLDPYNGDTCYAIDLGQRDYDRNWAFSEIRRCSLEYPHCDAEAHVAA